MNRKVIFRFAMIIVLFYAAFFSGCGGGPGTPGSDSGDLGVIVDVTVNPLYLGGNTSSVDVVQQICDPGPPPEIEPFTDHQATVTFNARLINTNPQITPGTIFIEKYTVQYRRSLDSIGSPPIESDTRFKTIVVTPPPLGAGTTTTIDTVVFLDLPRKDRYLTDMTSGQFSSALNNPFIINNYTATFIFEGKNQYGKTYVSGPIQTDFQIGSFDNCP